jgi:hypothetical protein
MKRNPKQCFACTSRKCSHRIVTRHGHFSEIACAKHSRELYRYSDAVVPGVLRMFEETTGTYERGRVMKDDSFTFGCHYCGLYPFNPNLNNVDMCESCAEAMSGPTGTFFKGLGGTVNGNEIKMIA